MDKAFISGSAVTPNAIYVQPEEDLIMRCIVDAAADAGIGRHDIKGLISMTPRPQTVQHYQTQHIASRLGLKVDILCEMEMAALGINNAIRWAASLIQERNLPAVAIVASSCESRVPTAEFFGNRTSRTSDASFAGPFGMAPMVWNAMGAREMLASGEATETDFADVVVRLRNSGALNPVAYFRKPVTVDEVLGSRMVASPLRLLMVCPRVDGAACLIMTNEAVAKRNPGRAIAHIAQGMSNDGDSIIPERAGRSFAALPATGVAMRDALNRSGLDYDAIDVIEPFVPFSPMEIMVMRGLGFERDYAKKRCVSPSGGVISRGHPLLATPFYNIHEIVQQLRGDAGPRQAERARIGMMVSETGNYNTCVVDIYSRLDA